MRLLKRGNLSLNGANHGLSLFMLGGKFGIKLCLKDSSKCLCSLFGQQIIGSYSKWHKQHWLLSFLNPLYIRQVFNWIWTLLILRSSSYCQIAKNVILALVWMVGYVKTPSDLLFVHVLMDTMGKCANIVSIIMPSAIVLWIMSMLCPFGTKAQCTW